MSTEIKIDPDAMKALVLKAILDSWDDATRDQLVTDALASLLKDKEGSSWDRNSITVIESIMKSAMREACMKAVREIIDSSPKLQTKIKEFVTPLVDTVLSQNIAFFEQAVAEALVDKIRGGRH